MSWIAALAGAGLGAAGGGVNGLLSGWHNKYNAESAAKYNYQLQRRALEEFPKAKRKGLLAAGYNPMLALEGGVPSYTGGVSAGSTGGYDILSSAAQGSKLANDIAKAIDLANEQKKLENANLESDLETKEIQRAQMEAQRSLLESQEDRIALAYGRDIVDTVTSVAGTVGSLYSAKAMSDVAKQNALINARNATVNERRLDSHTSETRYDKRGKVQGRTERSTFSHGVPTTNHTANPKIRPSVMGALGSSAKTVGNVAKALAPLIVSPVVSELAKEAEKSSHRIQDFDRKDSGYYKRRYWQPKRVLLH